jgi:hypothetical protein
MYSKIQKINKSEPSLNIPRDLPRRVNSWSTCSQQSSLHTRCSSYSHRHRDLANTDFPSLQTQPPLLQSSAQESYRRYSGKKLLLADDLWHKEIPCQSSNHEWTREEGKGKLASSLLGCSFDLWSLSSVCRTFIFVVEFWCQHTPYCRLSSAIVATENFSYAITTYSYLRSIGSDVNLFIMRVLLAVPAQTDSTCRS